MIQIDWNARDLLRLSVGRSTGAIKRALRKAGSTALRDMRSEASKRIRARKRIRAKYVREAMSLRRAKGGSIEGMEWGIDFTGKSVPLTAYPVRQTRRGVSVEVNRGKRTLVPHAFIATMGSGHRGVFVRRGAKRLPIRELVGSRPVDAMLHKGEAEGVLARGQRAFALTFARVLPMEIDK